MLMNVKALRRNNFILLLISLTLVGYAYFYMEKTLYLTPCPLCYAQRLVFFLMALFYFLLLFTRRLSGLNKCWTGLAMLSGVGGSMLSIRHLYIQNLPKDKVPNCGMDFYGMLSNSPFSDLIYTMLTGSGDCAETQWTFLSLSIPGWTLICFVIMITLTYVNNIRWAKVR